MFKSKRDSSGKIIRYQTRLVEKGFTQYYGVDDIKTYLPVICYLSVRTLFVLAIELDLEIHHLDVEVVFFKW